MVVQRPRTPVFARRERDLPVLLRKTFPPVQLHDAREAELFCEVADAPRHEADFRGRQPAQRRLVKMVEVRVRQQHQINRWQILHTQAGTLEPLEQEQPVREVRVHQHIQVIELDEERRMADPSQRHLTMPQARKNRRLMRAGALGEPAFPDHLLKKRARIEVFRRRQILERARNFPARRFGTVGTGFRHGGLNLTVASRNPNCFLPPPGLRSLHG